MSESTIFDVHPVAPISPMQSLWHRQHRSGLKVPTFDTYRAKRKGLIGYSHKKRKEIAMAGYKAGLDSGQVIGIQKVWKLYDREEIVNRLNVLCPGHEFTKVSLKIPMLILWIQNEDIANNAEAKRRIARYPSAKLFHVPPERNRRPKR